MFPFTRNDPDKLIWPDSMYPVGLYNLPIARQGKYLVFMPLDTENAADISVSEIRVWQMKDLANSAILTGPTSTVYRYVGPIGEYCVLGYDTSCKNYGNFEASAKPFYADLGGLKTLSGIWLLLGN